MFQKPDPREAKLARVACFADLTPLIVRKPFAH